MGCWEQSTKVGSNINVDDLLIFAEISPIDGQGGILGQAGPCIVTQNYARVGLMQFDSADMNSLSDKELDSTIEHEMLLIIGIGTLWSGLNLNREPDKFYKGANGREGNIDIGGSGNPIVEQDGGQGTAYGHWDKEIYGDEIMTGFLSARSFKSALTIKSL